MATEEVFRFFHRHIFEAKDPRFIARKDKNSIEGWKNRSYLLSHRELAAMYKMIMTDTEFYFRSPQVLAKMIDFLEATVAFSQEERAVLMAKLEDF